MASLGHIPLHSKLEMKCSPTDIPRMNPRPLVKLPSLGRLHSGKNRKKNGCPTHPMWLVMLLSPPLEQWNGFVLGMNVLNISD